MLKETSASTSNPNIIEFFFDYACPYCYQAYQTLAALLHDSQKARIVWRPCESHPRPSNHRPHSDLCIQAMFFALDNNIDIWRYHALVFSLIHDDGMNVEDIDTLAQQLSRLVDADSLRRALNCEMYTQYLHNANHYTFEQSGILAVPSLRANGNKLDAALGVGITSEQLQDFLAFSNQL